MSDAPRQHPLPVYRGLKTAARKLVADVGGLEACAAACRAGRSQLSQYQHTLADLHMPVDVVADLEAIGGVPHVTEALARAQGYELLPVELRHRGEVGQALGQLGSSVGELFREVAIAFADGKLTDEERGQLLAQLDHVVRLGNEARAILRSDLDR